MSSSLLPAHTFPAPQVSVVIPTYNRSELLIAAIESVLRQTFTDYELIVIDDGSTDDTRARLEPYADRIRYFHQPNQGASAAQNAGTRVARGEWIAILASDDTWLPAKLERQLNALASLISEFGVCVTDCNFIRDSETESTAFEEGGLSTDAEFGEIMNPVQHIVGQYGIYMQSMLIRRSLFQEVGGFDETLGVSEDRDLIFRLSFRTRFCYVSAPLVNINRKPDVARLTNLICDKNDQSYGWMELSHKKMLDCPELVDGEMRRAVEDELTALYYSWAIERLQEMRLGTALDKIAKIRRLGASYRSILYTLLSRARGKLGRKLRMPVGRR